MNDTRELQEQSAKAFARESIQQRQLLAPRLPRLQSGAVVKKAKDAFALLNWARWHELPLSNALPAGLGILPASYKERVAVARQDLTRFRYYLLGKASKAAGQLHLCV